MTNSLRDQINVPDMHKSYYQRGNTAILYAAKETVSKAEGSPNVVTQVHPGLAHDVAFGVKPDVDAVLAAKDPDARVIAQADLERNAQNATRVALASLGLK